MGKDKLKSAYELAMERLAKNDPEMVTEELPEDKKLRIQDIRKEYDSKIAEREIMFSSKIKDLARAFVGAELLMQRNELESEHRKSIAALKMAMEEKIKVVRGEQ